MVILLRADESRRVQERVGGALGWLGGRCSAGGAVEGGGSSARLTVGTGGGTSRGASAVSIACWPCRVAHSGQTRQSRRWDGLRAGALPLSSVWQSTAAATTGSVRGPPAPARSCAISARSTANSLGRRNRRAGIGRIFRGSPWREP